jgi:hypothetical protein
MKTTTKHKAFRSILSALLSSPLNDKELREFSAELKINKELAEELANLLQGALISPPTTLKVRTTPAPSKASPYKSDADLIERALLIAKQRRLSRRDLSYMLAALLPRHRDALRSDSLSARQILEMFFQIADTTTATEALNLLEGKNTNHPDAFLREILRRS